MIKRDMIHKIGSELNMPKYKAEEIVSVFLNILKETIENGEDIELRGFGCFRIRNRKSRMGRNPMTGKAFPIPAKKIVKFKQSINLKIME